MKGITLSDIQQIKKVDMPMPQIEADTDVLLKIEEVGVCGSDVHYYETGRIDLDIHTARRKELTLVNVRRQNRCTQTAIDWMADGRLNVDFMVTHRFAAEQCQQAFDLVAQYEDGVVKAMVEF